MTAPTRPAQLTSIPAVTPAWWVHLLNLALNAIVFVVVVIHPGWRPPVILQAAIGPLSLTLAVVSGLILAVLHHKAGTTTLSAAADYLHSHAYAFEEAARQLAPVTSEALNDVPGMKLRLDELETRLAGSPQLAPEVVAFLTSLAHGPASGPTPAAATIHAPTAAQAVSEPVTPAQAG